LTHPWLWHPNIGKYIFISVSDAKKKVRVPTRSGGHSLPILANSVNRSDPNSVKYKKVDKAALSANYKQQPDSEKRCRDYL